MFYIFVCKVDLLEEEGVYIDITMNPLKSIGCVGIIEKKVKKLTPLYVYSVDEPTDTIKQYIESFESKFKNLDIGGIKSMGRFYETAILNSMKESLNYEFCIKL
jgi:hypothetical protein